MAAGLTRMNVALGMLEHGARDFLVGPLELEAVEVPDEFARMEGSFRDIAMELTTDRFSGGPGGCIRSMTLAVMRAGEDIISVTIAGYPDPKLKLPILGIDYVSLRGKLSLAVCDLSPLVMGDWDEVARPEMERLSSAVARRGLPQRKRPEFARDTFSPLASFGAARVGQELGAAHEALSLMDAYARMCERAVSREDASREQAAAAMGVWCEAMKTNKKEIDALTMIFGERATRYLDTFLFDVDTSV